MSDPRMIPADEAQRVLDKISRGLTITYLDVPGLAHTVVEQADRIEQLDTELVRLRREIEELRDNLADPWQAQTGYEHGLQAGYDYAAYTLTRILEGHNDGGTGK